MRSGETRPPNTIPLAVVIPTWNGQRTIAACLASLEVLFPAELLMVDNASTDRTKAIARGSTPAARLITLAQNVGFAAACNRGILATVAPFVLLLNQDAVIDSSGIRALLAALVASPRAAAASGRITNPDGSLQPSMGPEPHPFRVALDRIPGLRILLPSHVFRHPRWYRVKREPAWLTGACLLLRRAALEDVGPFDERYFMYAEDRDWCARARRRGWTLLYLPAHVAVHRDEGRTLPDRTHAKARWMRAGLLRYFESHGSPVQTRMFRALLGIEKFIDYLRAIPVKLVLDRARGAGINAAALSPSAIGDPRAPTNGFPLSRERQFFTGPRWSLPLRKRGRERQYGEEP